MSTLLRRTSRTVQRCVLPRVPEKRLLAVRILCTPKKNNVARSARLECASCIPGGAADVQKLFIEYFCTKKTGGAATNMLGLLSFFEVSQTQKSTQKNKHILLAARALVAILKNYSMKTPRCVVLLVYKNPNILVGVPDVPFDAVRDGCGRKCAAIDHSRNAMPHMARGRQLSTRRRRTCQAHGPAVREKSSLKTVMELLSITTDYGASQVTVGRFGQAIHPATRGEKRYYVLKLGISWRNKPTDPPLLAILPRDIATSFNLGATQSL